MNTMTAPAELNAALLSRLERDAIKGAEERWDGKHAVPAGVARITIDALRKKGLVAAGWVHRPTDRMKAGWVLTEKGADVREFLEAQNNDGGTTRRL